MTTDEKQRHCALVEKIKADLIGDMLDELSCGCLRTMSLIEAMDPYGRLKVLEDHLEKFMMRRVGFCSSVLRVPQDAGLDLQEAVTKYVEVSLDDFESHGGEIRSLPTILEVIEQYRSDYLGRGLRPDDIDVYSCRLLDSRTMRLSGMSDMPDMPDMPDMHAVYQRQNSGAWLLIALQDGDFFEFLDEHKTNSSAEQVGTDREVLS